MPTADVITFTEHLIDLSNFPHSLLSSDVLKPFFPDCQPPEDAARMLAVCCIRKKLKCLSIKRFDIILIAHSCVDVCQLLLGEMGDECSRHLHLREAAGAVHHHCSRSVSSRSRLVSQNQVRHASI